MKLLICSFYFPPAGGGGVQRPLKLAAHLAGLGIEVHVLAPDDPKWIHRDEALTLPPQVVVHRARYHGPRGRRPAEELYGLAGGALLERRLALLPRRLLVPDENVVWCLSAIPHAVSLVRRERISLVLTTSPPNSIHLIGAAAKAAGAAWVADLRDSITANADRPIERAAARAKERVQYGVARLVARHADAVVTVSDAIGAEIRDFRPNGEVRTIRNGCDFDDFDGLAYRAGTRFRITHTGSFFGKRTPRPFLTALTRSDPDVVARFVGDMRSVDRDWAEHLHLGDRLEIHPFVPHRVSLALQRDSEALLLLLPHAGARGASVPSGKVFEYLAAERPILAAVPPDGAAASLIREAGAGIVVDPNDPDAIAAGLNDLVARWRDGALAPVRLPAELRARLSRRTRAEELLALLRSLDRRPASR